MIKRGEMEDLGVRIIDGHSYYVTKGISGKEYLTSIEEANLDGCPARFRLYEDLSRMGDEERSEILNLYPELAKAIAVTKPFQKCWKKYGKK